MGEEAANATTHAIGLLLALIGAVWLLRSTQTVPETISCTIYAISLIGVYAMSTATHAAIDPTWKGYFRQWDQGFIFLLVVATYTPFSVAYLTGWWWVLLGGMWSAALFAFVAKVFCGHEQVMVAPQLVLGWLPLLAVPKILSMLPAMALVPVVAGGLCYSVGVYFLLNDNVPYYHVVWHMLVMAGSVLHYFAILWYALPPKISQ